MWTSPNDLKVQLLRLWERGELLRDAVSGASRFPLRLVLKGPGSADLTDRFEAVRAWVSELAAGFPFRLEWQEVRHRVQGLQRLPASVWVDSIEDAVGWIGKRRDWARFSVLIETSRQSHPSLLPWLERRPLQALELAGEWPRLLSVVDWLRAHPRPGLYLRQVNVPGVHTKFIEAHRSVLAELFDLALPTDCVDAARTGVARFEARYGFREKPLRIRFRILDPDVHALPGTSCPDIALDADSFSRLALDVRQVFITENEANFLALPNVPGALVIFGSGYGWEALAGARWLERCAIHYWGDIDTHGFAILDQFRGYFPHAASFLMDRATLDAHAALWGYEDAPKRSDLRRLTWDEQDLYDALRDDRIRAGLRLEQEHVGFDWVSGALGRLRR
ncbi:DUF3322 domain-containing protein [Chitinimonas koreensis]|uniref:DUF3322 domain-containing protein n=1 Tax=Chitinimonas koreensis TaxID=356302 RepID=UPI00041DC920|nr:DUF3322 domain-containing protein [Chitinimonas koreensis]